LRRRSYLVAAPDATAVNHTQQNSSGENRIFISHGQSTDWQHVQTFLERELDVRTLELAQEPNKGRFVLEKLDQESARCCYAVIVITDDDETTDGALRARENVMHEIGFFQARFGRARVCLLHEDRTNIPSNIHGLVYLQYPKGVVRATFSDLRKELKAVGLAT
jgi:predicted nucleotide-binding protein